MSLEHDGKRENKKPFGAGVKNVLSPQNNGFKPIAVGEKSFLSTYVRRERSNPRNKFTQSFSEYLP